MRFEENSVNGMLCQETRMLYVYNTWINDSE